MATYWSVCRAAGTVAVLSAGPVGQSAPSAGCGCSTDPSAPSCTQYVRVTWSHYNLYLIMTSWVTSLLSQHIVSSIMTIFSQYIVVSPLEIWQCINCFDSLLVECQTHDWKVASSNPGRSSRRIFFSRFNSLCWLLFGVHSTPMLPQWNIKKTLVILPKVQVAGYIWTCIHPWPNEFGVGWLCSCPGIAWERIRKKAHKQLIRELSATVVSAPWATVDWSWPKEWN